MNNIPEQQQTRVSPADQRFCSYCQAPLNPLFYFCSRCATPYKASMSLLGPEKEFPMSTGEAIRRKAPNAAPLFWAYFTLIIVFSLVNLIFFEGEDRNSVLPLLLASTGMAIITLVVAIKFRYSLKALFNARGLFNRYILIGLGGLAGLLLVNYLYHSLIYFLLEYSSGYTLNPGNYSMNIYLKYFLICLLPAVTEEIAFRGLMQKWLGSALGLKKAFLLCSALFALLHFSLVSFPYMFLLGLFLSWIREKTGSLYPVMTLHFLHNFVVLTFFGF